MRIPPHPEGHGGNQRAWFLVNALRRIDTVHLALIYPAADDAAASVSLEAVRPLVAGITIVPCPEWSASSERWEALPWAIGTWIDRVRLGSVDAPRLSVRTLRAIAHALPARAYDHVFAARCSIATIADTLLRRRMITARRRVLDVDDIMSTFRRRQRDADLPDGPIGLARLVRENWRAAQASEIAVLDRAERHLATTWDAVSLCSDEDVAHMRRRAPGARLLCVPNVVDRPLLPPRHGNGARILFIGNLRFAPNSQGLGRFLAEAWPRIRAGCPGAELTIVGFSPPPELEALLESPGVATFVNVPQVEPYYAAADVVIAPIFFGGGTRIKILEAMAFGRAVVSTAIGAEGLGAVPAVDMLIADDMAGFAAAVLRLVEDGDLRTTIAENGHRLQRTHFSPAALDHQVGALLRLANRSTDTIS